MPPEGLSSDPNRPAYAVLAEAFQKLSPEEQRKARQPVHRPVVNEYPEDFRCGDFPVRNLYRGS